MAHTIEELETDENGKMSVEVFSDGAFGRTLIGSATISIAELVESLHMGPIPYTLPLSTQGEVDLVIESSSSGRATIPTVLL